MFLKLGGGGGENLPLSPTTEMSIYFSNTAVLKFGWFTDFNPSSPGVNLKLQIKSPHWYPYIS